MKQIYVVEGKNDVNKLKEVYPSINAISVNGSEIDLEVVKYLISLKDTHEIIIITDPDYPGLKIRNELEEKIGKVSHIFLDRKKSFSKNKKKIGLEHLKNEDIKEIMDNIFKPTKTNNYYTLDFLYDYKLIGDVNSNTLRNYISDKYNLGYVNGKRLLKRLNNSNIKKEDIINTLKEFYNHN